MFTLEIKDIKRRWRLAFAVFALVIALAYDFLFWHVGIMGFGFILFVALYTVGFTILAIESKELNQPKALWLLLPIFVLSIDVLFYTNVFVQHFVPLVVALLLFVYSFLSTLRNPEKIKFDFLKLKFLKKLRLIIDNFSLLIKDFDFAKKTKNSDLYKKILLGIVVAIPLLLVFFALFLSADAVFASKVFKLFSFTVDPSTVFRIFRLVFLSLAISVFFYILFDPAHKIEKSEIKSLKIDKVVATVVLSLINLLFFSFVVIQLQYLFGSNGFVIENGIKFADYARQGFFQLAWVIALVAIVLMFFYKSASEHGSHIALKLLKIFLILQVGVIAMSALKRMNLYQDAYGFTTLRLYVEWFIYFCLTILTFTAVSLSIDFEFRKFFNIVVILGISALVVVSSINVDILIARQNIDRYLNDGKAIDLNYLNRLSSDAAKEIKRLPDKIDMSRQSMAGVIYYPDELKNNPSAYIINWWKTRYSNENVSWKEFNFSIEKLKKL